MGDPEQYWTQKAESLQNLGKYEDALKCFDKVKQIKKNKTRKDFWYLDGCSYVEIGNYEKAIECFDNDLKQNKESYDSWYAKGFLLFLSKKYLPAVECFNKATEIKYSEFLKLTNQAETLKEIRKFERSIKHLDQAKQIEPFSNKFWHYKGLTLHEIGRYDEAIECFKAALEQKTDPIIMYDMARSELMMGNIESCLALLEKSCMLDNSCKSRLQIDKIFDRLIDNGQFRSFVSTNRIFDF